MDIKPRICQQKNGNLNTIMYQITTLQYQQLAQFMEKIAFFCFLWTRSGQNYTLNFMNGTRKCENHQTSENALLISVRKQSNQLQKILQFSGFLQGDRSFEFYRCQIFFC